MSLVGDVVETGMLPFKFTPALLTVEALKAQALLRRDKTLGETRGSGDPQIDASVWQQTLEECEKGGLTGPLGRA